MRHHPESEMSGQLQRFSKEGNNFSEEKIHEMYRSSGKKFYMMIDRYRRLHLKRVYTKQQYNLCTM
jgi:hypothetical protein